MYCGARPSLSFCCAGVCGSDAAPLPLGVSLLVVVVVVAVALVFPRHVRVLVVGWLCLNDGSTVAASRRASAS